MIAALKNRIGHMNPVRLGWHYSKSVAAALRYGFPARGLTVIGITGTDGKTTTVGMTAHILAQEGIKVGALSTAFFQFENERVWNATQKTSPSPFTVQKFLKTLRNKGCTHAILEYSSHGMVQGRVNFTWPKVAAITNLTPEHLDYHGTMEAYRDAKGILLKRLRGRGVKVLNAKDATFAHYSRIPSSRTIAFSSEPGQQATLWADKIEAEPTKTRATLRYEDQSEKLTLNIPGSFNIENALAAIGCAMGVGVPFDHAVKALGTFVGVPGRMEPIDEGQPYSVLVDFTVTPAAYERTLTTLKSALPKGKRLLVLTGSCGDRMKEKRPEVGRICSLYGDVVVVTNEDPYTEDPEKIIDEVLAGAQKGKADVHRIIDRKEAITFLLDQAEPDDVVILCGKGSDTTMWLAHGKVPWNEREIVRGMLKERSGKEGK